MKRHPPDPLPPPARVDEPGALTRRELLRGVPALGLATLAPGALAGCGDNLHHMFQHGVASGDPLPDRVILWTRVSPSTSAPVSVTWQVATDPTLLNLVAFDSVQTDAARDFTVKVDPLGLEPGRTYYYRFVAEGQLSPIGRTRTAPEGMVARARFGVASCSSYAQGYFHAYRALAGRADLDAVIHLGDYIYESGPGQFGSDRVPDPPRETLTLADYRRRHAQHKRDPDLQEAHRQHPFITVWDDHETANNAWSTGAPSHDPATRGPWADRKAAAQRAYSEWMPIRDQVDTAKIWRTLAWGDLLDLILLDTRLWARTESDSALLAVPPPLDATKTLLGDDQAAWLEERIAGSTARWKVVAQQVMVASLTLSPGMIINLDQWHGYPASRQRFFDFLRASGANNVVVLTGDIHSSFANELVLDATNPAAYDPMTGAGAVAVEFVTPGITSPGLPPEFLAPVEAARPYNPHVRWYDLLQQGYLVLDVTPERTQSAWFLYADIKPATGAVEVFGTAWSVPSGSTRLQRDDAPAPPPDQTPPPAP